MNMTKKPKTKVCSGCGKERPIWKNKTIEGVKKSFCQPCAIRVESTITKKKKAEARAKKANSISKLTEVLDKTFSLFIRLRDTDRNGIFTCCTCHEKKEWHQLNAGHFISRRFMNTRWDEENVAPQCYGCNVMQYGQQYLFAKWIDKTYGEGKADELLQRSREVVKFSDYELREMIELYKQKLMQLKT